MTDHIEHQEKMHSRHISWRLRILLGLIVIFLAGSVGTFFIARWADRGQRESLYEVANLIRYSVDTDKIKKLSGSPTDVSEPAYQELQKTFTELGNATKKIRYIYLMGRRNQQEIYFYLDSQPTRFAKAVDQPPLATPGEVYTDVTDGVLDVFFNGTSTVVGPETDKWGTFVSALIPVRNTENNVIALLGVDVEAAEFQANVRARILIALVGTLCLALAYVSLLLYKRHTSKRLEEDSHSL